MSRRAASITQADVARAIRAAQQCGAGAVEIKPDGTIRVVLTAEAPTQPVNEVEQATDTIEPDDEVVL